MNRPLNNYDIASQLQIASAAVMELELQRRNVLAYHFNGREPVLLVDAAPSRITTNVVYRREPDGKGGALHRYATRMWDVRIEWQSGEPAAAEVANG
jgi:hypothetical protein